jgi:hypothetical protein
MWMELSGIVTPEELKAGNQTIANMIEDADDGLFLVRDGRGLREIQVPATSIARIATWFENSKFAGMILISSPDSMHLEITGEFMARLKHIEVESAFTVAEVHERLLAMDASLADKLPSLNG